MSKQQAQAWSNRVKLMSPQQPASRMRKAMLSLGITDAQLREGGHVSPNSRLRYPYEDKIKQTTGGTPELLPDGAQTRHKLQVGGDG